MGNDTKWADVAHYYAFSGIMGKLNWGPNSINLPLDNPQDAALIHDRLDHIRSGQIVFVPILRHRDDMTEAEDHECMLVHTRWVEGEDLRRVIWDLAKQHKTFDQYSTHWLVSRGFDVFGLIESGQAIRKEMGNGNS